MSRINIPLDPDIVPPDLPAGADTKLSSHKFFLDLLGDALASERGLRLNYDSAATAKGARMKFYAARRYVSRQGITSFDRLTLTIDATSLLIKKDEAPKIIPL